MNSIVNFVSHFKDFYYDINGSTFTGAIDVIVVEQPDGTFTCSPFHVRFGKLGVLHSKEKIVDIEINGVPLDFHMKLGDCGEAFFVERVDENNLGDDGVDQRNLYCSPIPVDSPSDQGKNTEIYTNGFSSVNVYRKESQTLIKETFNQLKDENNQTIQKESQPKIFCAETSKIKVSEKISSLNSDFRPILLEPIIDSVNLNADTRIETKRSEAVIDIVQSMDEEQGTGRESQKSDGDMSGDRVKKRKKMFKKRGKKTSDDSSTSRTDLKALNLESSLSESLNLEIEEHDSNDVLQTVSETFNRGSTKSLHELRSSTSMELAGLDHSTPNDNDFHFFSDSEAGPESCHWDDRRLNSILSDSELDKQYGESGTEPEKHSWKWGELPTPPQQSKSMCSPRREPGETAPSPSDIDHQEQHRSMLSGMFSFMKKTKYIRHNPESKDVYLSDINVDKLDPEVSALYFPHSYSTRKIEETETEVLQSTEDRDVSETVKGDVVITCVNEDENLDVEAEITVDEPGSVVITEISEDEEKEMGNNPPELHFVDTSIDMNQKTELIPMTSEPESDSKVEIGENLQKSEENLKVVETPEVKIEDADRHIVEMKHDSTDTVINIEFTRSAELDKSVELDAKCGNEEDLESGYGASLPQSPDFVQQSKSETHRDVLKDVALSRCGGLSGKGPTDEAFQKSLVTYDDFSNNPKILDDPNLVVRLDGKYFNWKTACPIVLSIVVFNRGLSQNALDTLHREYMPKEKADKPAEAKSYTSWWSWRRSEQKKAVIKEERAVDVVKVEEEQVKKEEKEETTEVLYNNDKFPQSVRVLYRKTLRLSSDQIKNLNLKSGENEVVFSVTSAYQGTTQCKCHIYRWRYDDKVVISDIDGTITKSDVLGHLLPILGKDWAQSGVAQLFNKIKNNGYKLLYLSARAIGQAGITRDYLKSIKQEELSLPEGPLLLSPTGLLNALCREVIEKKPEDFKIPCLKDIQALFPAKSNPFYAGYGNKVNDVWSYRAVGIPMFRIFTINHRGELKHEFTQTFQTTYSNLSYLVDHMFPPFSETLLYEDFSGFVYWREPIEDITIDPNTKKVVKKEADNNTGIENV